MVCKVCGQSIKSDFRFCPYCGERIISDYHDQYGELTPPFLIHPSGEDADEASSFYVSAPEEVLPDFGNEEEGKDNGFSRTVHEEPLPFSPEDEAVGFGVQGTSFQERTVDHPEDAPYYVYHPDGEIGPLSDEVGETPPGTSNFEKQRNFSLQQEQRGPGIGVKLLLAFGILVAAVGLAIVGYQLLWAQEAFYSPGLAELLGAIYKA